MIRLKHLLAAGSLLTLTAQAQTSTTPDPDNWYIGVGGGLHSSFLRYSDLNDDVFPKKTLSNGGMFGIFVQGEFGAQHQFAIRPEVTYTHRGGKLKNIGRDLKVTVTGDDIADFLPDDVNPSDITDLTIPYYELLGLKDVRYSLSAHYLDLRLPLIYQFGKKEAALRPYVYVAPIVGLCVGGKIKAEFRAAGGDDAYAYDGYSMDLSKKNMSSLYFAGAVGAGLKWQLRVGRHTCYLGAEVMYEHGFTDTYGDEKDGKATPVVFPEPLPQGTKVHGTRRMSGFEVRANIGIPLSVFKKAAPAPQPEPVVEVPAPRPAPTPDPVVVKEEKPCYTLEEVTAMMAKGESVEGKTICAINDAINFDFGRSEIKAESYGYLNNLAETLIRTNAKIKVKGHTDDRGTAEFNMELSRERAKAVVNYLVKRGVSSSKLTYEAYGESKPLTENNTEEGRSLNRRVEFEIMK